MTSPVPILLYHGVGRTTLQHLDPYVIAPDLFEEHLDLIDRRGHHSLTVSQYLDLLLHDEPLPERPVVVTFDDGFADFSHHAWPLLLDRQIATTLYVVTDLVGGRASWLDDGTAAPEMLTWDQIRALDAAGCEIGAHSRTHPELDTMPRPELEDEVRGSRVALALQLGHPVRSFAYPNGYHDRRAKEAARLAGFDSACAVRNMASSRDDDHFALARITIESDCTTEQLARYLDGEGLAVAPRRQAPRTIGWRAYRRARRRLVPTP